ncbi:hypothetical protein E3N88_22754 [Mikania micrantha]|uniref:NB-ARC domain-containing protein n=1 Tax=Mikania micrantha TaxID=192012 RepID=A0A5N6NCS0_9ASTR|nr:hypothetical protein E3N88_22754 [Mikania micrantha]
MNQEQLKNYKAAENENTTIDSFLVVTNKENYGYRRLYGRAIQLFKRHAYNEEDPVEDYETLSLSVISYASGLPLALKVIGSFLYDKNRNEWVSALDKLKEIPDLEVMDILKLSFDGLEAYQKELFLDVACFGKFIRLDDAMEIFEACVEEMGHYIVRGEHPVNPRKHSRVWKREEIEGMCFGDATMENDKSEALMLSKYFVSHSDDNDLSSCFCKIVSSMKNLRWVNMTMDQHVKSDGGPTFLSNELQLINWTASEDTPQHPPCTKTSEIDSLTKTVADYPLWYKRLFTCLECLRDPSNRDSAFVRFVERNTCEVLFEVNNLIQQVVSELWLLILSD